MLRGFFPLIDTARYRQRLVLVALVAGACGDDGTEATSSNTASGTDASTSDSDSDTIDPSDTADTSAGTVDPDSSSGPGESSGSTGVGPACGNDAVEDAEVCDGVDLAGQDCVSQGFGGGTLACADDCTAFDTSNCTVGGCTHDICAQGEALVVGCDDCVDQICALDPFCCDDSWDGQCVNEVNSICGIVCPGCGNDVIEGMEVCDGSDLALEDCVSQGFEAGTLACAADCSAFDTTACGDLGADCCVAHGSPGCTDDVCEASVCALDAFCCNNTWDGQCAGEALADPNCFAACGGAAVCGDDLAQGAEACDGTDLLGQDCVTQGFDGGTLACAGDCTGFDTTACTNDPSDCCIANGGLGCDDDACEAAVCAFDSWCCNNSWDCLLYTSRCV